jgi:hypothetical protein
VVDLRRHCLCALQHAAIGGFSENFGAAFLGYKGTIIRYRNFVNADLRVCCTAKSRCVKIITKKARMGFQRAFYDAGAKEWYLVSFVITYL